MADRTLLVQRYLMLQTKAAQLGIYGTAHITREMTDAEITRRGVELAARIEAAEADRAKKSELVRR